VSLWKLITARWGSGAGETDDVQMDAVTNALISIAQEHHEIHEGAHYFYADYALSQSSGSTREFVLTTPNNTKWIHLVWSVYAGDGATVELYKDASGITGGTSITPVNNNGNSANTSGVTLVKDPTSITSDGNRAAGYLAGAGRVAGDTKRTNEIMLEQNTIYLVRITSLANSNDISWDAEWYEHTDKN